MANKILIKNGIIVTSERQFHGDIMIENDKIIAVDHDIKEKGDTKIISAEGKYVIPGGIDPHVHMHLKLKTIPETYSSDDFYSGSRAGLAGGTTTFIDFVTPEDRNQPLMEAYYKRLEESEISCTDYSFHMTPISWRDSIPSELEQCVQEGMSSFKIYLSYLSNIGLQDNDLIPVMEAIGKSGGLAIAHCENGNMIDYLRYKCIREGNTSLSYHAVSRPAATEIEAIEKVLLISHYTNCPLYVVHVTTKDGAVLIGSSRAEGYPVFTEVCPHHLLLDASELERMDFRDASRFVMSPPLRSRTDMEGLWEQLQLGKIDTIATDHCPFMTEQKLKGENDFTQIPNGVPGIQHRLQLIYTFGVASEVLNMPQFVALTSTNSSKLFGMYPQKGEIAPGSDADIVIWDPNAETIITANRQLHNTDNTPYEGMKVFGNAETVLSRGEIVVNKGKVLAEKGRGKFIKRGKWQAKHEPWIF